MAVPIRSIPSFSGGSRVSHGMGKSFKPFRGKTGVVFDIKAYSKDNSELLWTRKAENLITTIGSEQLLINTFPASGETAISAWYVGLMATADYNATGSMTSGSADLTLGTALPTAMIVGQVVTVVGAGTSGANLVTTISSVTSTTAYVLATAAGTTVSSATVVAGPQLAIADTSASHAGWVEATTSQVTQTVRASYTVAAVSNVSGNGTKTNGANPAAYTGNTVSWWMSGVFLASSDVIGSTTDTLLSEAPFSSSSTPPGAALVQSGTNLQITAVFTMNAG